MATILAKAKRRADVQARLAATMGALAEHLSIEFPEPSRAVRDPELAAIIDLEYQANVLDAVYAAISGNDESEAADDPDMTFDRETLKEMKLDDLKALAIESGADEEAVKKMRSKDDVIDAMDALLTSGELEIGDADTGDADDEDVE